MSQRLVARLNRLDRTLAVVDAEEAWRAYSHLQLVRMAAHVAGHKQRPRSGWSRLVGPPAQVLREGEESHVELIQRAVRESGPRNDNQLQGDERHV
jgi:hypothetical protein